MTRSRRRTIDPSATGFIARLAKLTMSLILLWIPTACIELNERTLVSAVGIDRKEDGKLRVTLGLIGTKKEGPDELAVYSVDGETLFEASRKFIEVIGNQLMWPYIKLIVIGPSVARYDVMPILDYFNRNNEIQPNPYVAFSKGPAEEILKLKPDLPQLPTLIMEQQLKNQTLLATAPQTQLYQFNEMLYSPGGYGYAPMISKSTQSGRLIPLVAGMGVLKEGKWAGELDQQQARGVLWAHGDVRGGILVVGVEDQDRREQAKISLEILECTKASIHPFLKGDQITVTFDIHCRLAVGEILGYLSMSEEHMHLIMQRAAAEITREIKASLKVAQQDWQADIYGIHRAVQRKYPEYWKAHKDQWPSVFADIPVNTEVDVEIHKVGLLESYPGK